MAAAKVLHDKRFPGESPAYRRARNGLLKDEIELRRNIEKVAARRRKLPPGGIVRKDYVFDASVPGETGFREVRLSELFAPGKDTLFLYNFMFPREAGPKSEPCPSCTSIIDSVDGAAKHFTQRINFAIVAKAPIEKFRQHARRRGWKNTTLLSSANNTYNRDYNAETPDGWQLPIASIFTRKGGKIRHFWSSELFFAKAVRGQDMRHVDFIWPVWSVLDITPEGRGKDWGPEIEYS